MKKPTENILRPNSHRLTNRIAAARLRCGRSLVVSSLAASLLVAGCASRPSPTPALTTARPQAFDEVYRLVDRRFESAHLIKPADGSMTGLMEGDLAPLIVREVTPRGLRLDLPLAFGRLFFEDGAVRIDPAEPMVYVQTGRREINGRTHQAVAYCVFHAGAPSANPRIAVTILRAILDTDGFPLVWEVIQSVEPGTMNHWPQALYVSRSLETAATDRFGPPLPGRRHSSEPSRVDAPRSVVARIFEDGPMPLGPYLYAAADTGRITALHCRCSEAQMNEVLESTYYELVLLEDVADIASDVLRRAFPISSGNPLTLTAGLPLNQALRWPQ